MPGPGRRGDRAKHGDTEEAGTARSHGGGSRVQAARPQESGCADRPRGPRLDRLPAGSEGYPDNRAVTEATMARVRNIHSGELPPDLAAIYEEFAGSYGPFGNQVAVFAHVPAALRHLMPLLLELRTAKTLPKRALELAIVTVSHLNACHYCVAHHKPFLAVEGVSPAGAERPFGYQRPPELDGADKPVLPYAIAPWEQPTRLPDA